MPKLFLLSSSKLLEVEFKYLPPTATNWSLQPVFKAARPIAMFRAESVLEYMTPIPTPTLIWRPGIRLAELVGADVEDG